MKYLGYVISIWMMCFLSGCGNDEATGNVSANELIRTITAAPVSDNVLRMNIDVETHCSTDITIEYWKKGGGKHLTASSSAASASHRITLLFLEAETEYSFQVTASTGKAQATTDTYTFTTKELPASLPAYRVTQNDLGDINLDGYILIAQQTKPGYLVLLNQDGNIVWYYRTDQPVTCANYDSETRTFLCLIGNNAAKSYTCAEWRIVDLYGNVLLSKPNTELANSYIHHDVCRLRDGNYAMVNFVPGEFDLSAFGGDSKQTVYGDGITIYDAQGNKVWEWNCFSERTPDDDPNVIQVLDRGGLVTINRIDDWLHANAVAEDTDGNLLVSFNFINEIWKINRTTGEVMYRLGKDGNVEMPDDAQTQGIHSVALEEDNTVICLDNGTQRQQTRYLSFQIDEASKKATLKKCIAFPKNYCSQFQGSAKRIADNLYLYGASMKQCVLLTDADGNPLWVCEASHTYFRAQYVRP